MNSFVTLTNRKYIDAKTANIVPTKIIYLYLNPCLEEHGTTVKRANKVREDICVQHKKYFSNKEWYYAEPCSKFLTEIMTIYGSIKHILYPNSN